MNAKLVFAVGGTVCLLFSVVPAFAGNAVTIEPTGKIIETCSLKGFNTDSEKNVSLGTLTNSKPSDIERSFGVYCNAPFKLSMVSSAGGLQRKGAAIPVLGGTFADRLAYSVTAIVPTDEAAVTLNKTCSAASATATGGCDATSGSATALSTSATSATLKFAFEAPSAPLLAGQYEDILTISVVAQ